MRSVEARVRWLVRAWPAADRAERGDEIVATALDLVPAGRSHLPLRLSANLVLGGVKARCRARPPIGRWLLYACFAVVPAQGNGWVESDLMRPGFGRRFRTRVYLTRAALALAFAGPLALLPDFGPVSSLIFGWELTFCILGWGYRLKMTVLERAGIQMVKEGKYGAAAHAGRQLLDGRSRGRPRWLPPSAATRNRLRAAARIATQLRLNGGEHEAAELLAEVFERGKQRAPRLSTTWAAGTELAYTLLCNGRVDVATAIGWEVHRTTHRRHGPNARPAVDIAAIVGACLSASGQPDAAIPLLGDAYVRGKRLFPGPDWPTWWAGFMLARTLFYAGRTAEAIEVGAEVLAARRHLLGPDHLATLEAASSLGAHLAAVGRLDEALALLADTFARGKRHAPDRDCPTWLTGHDLAAALARAGRVNAAVEVGAEVLAARRRLLGFDHDDTLRTASDLAANLRSAGRMDEASDLITDSHGRAEHQRPDEELLHDA